MTESNRAPGPVALVGSGEYLPQMAAVEGGLLEGRPARYVQLATASVPDGPEVVARWHDLGRAQAERLGVEAVIVPVASRADAQDPAMAALVGGAGLVYLSGGDPHFLADTLRDTLVWRAIEATWREGAALAGCSAGAMALGAWIPSIRHPQRAATAGLSLFGRLGVIPHFDAFGRWVPDFLTRMVLPSEDAVTVLGIDEETALVGGPSAWRVEGRASVWRLNAARREQWPAGTAVELALA